MKGLLDEHVPHELRLLPVGHDVYTLRYLKWPGTKNGALLRRAAAGGFDVVLTLDGGIEHEQNQQTLPVAVLIVDAPPPGNMVGLRPLVLDILGGLARIAPRTILHAP